MMIGHHEALWENAEFRIKKHVTAVAAVTALMLHATGQI